MDAILQALQSIGIIPKQKILSPLPASTSPGGYNDPTQQGLNYYYQREAFNDRMAQLPQSQLVKPQTVTPTPTQPQGFDLGAIGQAIKTINSPNQTAQAQDMPQYSKGFVMSTPDKYIPVIDSAANNNNIPQSILSAALNQESGFNPDVISGKKPSSTGAQGIAQFMPETAKGMGINPLDTTQAINGMAKLLASYKNRFGSWDLALAAYNAGPGAVQQYKGIPPYPETQNYVKNIMQNAKTTFRRK